MQEFLRYVKSTWGTLLDADWINQPKITQIILGIYGTTIEAFVYLEPNQYYKINENSELVIAEYNPDYAIKTKYDLSGRLLVKLALADNVIKEFGLSDDVEIKIFDFTDGLQIDKYLSRRLEREEESYAEVLWCIANDL